MKFFLYGTLAAAGSLVFQTLTLIFLGQEALPDIFWKEASLLLATFVFWEECFKFIFAEKIIFSEKNNSLASIIIMGLGFSFFEIFLSVAKNSLNTISWPIFFMLGGILAVHLATLFIARNLLRQPSYRPIFFHRISILSLMFLLHFLYNIVIIKLT
jgi:hypothetical protein